jgi:hypothetical protein
VVGWPFRAPPIFSIFPSATVTAKAQVSGQSMVQVVSIVYFDTIIPAIEFVDVFF